MVVKFTDLFGKIAITTIITCRPTVQNDCTNRKLQCRPYLESEYVSSYYGTL